MRTIFRTAESRSDVKIWEISLINRSDGVAVYAQDAGSLKREMMLICVINETGITLKRIAAPGLPLDNQGFMNITLDGGR